MSSLQRELAQERERHERLQESVEQLRLELQMMGRLLAAAREQLVASGATAVEPSIMVRNPPPQPADGQRVGRSKSDAKRMQRLNEELAESRAQARQLAFLVEQQQQRMQIVSASKRELLNVVSEMGDYLNDYR